MLVARVFFQPRGRCAGGGSFKNNERRVVQAASTRLLALPARAVPSTKRAQRLRCVGHVMILLVASPRPASALATTRWRHQHDPGDSGVPARRGRCPLAGGASCVPAVPVWVTPLAARTSVVIRAPVSDSLRIPTAAPPHHRNTQAVWHARTELLCAHSHHAVPAAAGDHPPAYAIAYGDAGYCCSEVGRGPATEWDCRARHDSRGRSHPFVPCAPIGVSVHDFPS